MKKKKHSRNRINKLQKISKELIESFGNFTKTDKKIINKIPDIIDKQKRIYSNKINLLKIKKIGEGIPLDYIEKILNNRLKDYNREKIQKN